MAMNWLPLTEYSSKYQVSISTLRRRIKADEIEYQLKDGRYLILDEPRQEHRPSPAVSPSPLDSESAEHVSTKQTPAQLEHVSIGSNPRPKSQEEPILEAANRLLAELKKAYTQILHDKEEQVIHLKNEIADLKTLVRVLESDNERLRGRQK